MFYSFDKNTIRLCKILCDNNLEYYNNDKYTLINNKDGKYDSDFFLFFKENYYSGLFNQIETKDKILHFLNVLDKCFICYNDKDILTSCINCNNYICSECLLQIRNNTPLIEKNIKCPFCRFHMSDLKFK